MDRAALEAKLQEYTLLRQAASVKAGELQDAYNKTVVDVHQLDGAIGAITGLLNVPAKEPEKT